MKKIIKKATVLATGTITSRVLGLIRDLVLAFYLGTSDYMEAFLVAFRIPNVLRSLLAEEAVDAVTVPLISPYKNEEYFKKLSGRLLRVAALSLLIFVLFGVMFAPALLKVIAPGFYCNPAKAQLTIESLRIVFLYLLLVGMSAHSAGVLFVRGRYVVPAFTPIFLNVFLVAAAYFSFACGLNPVYTLSFAVLGAGTLQLVCHLYRARDSIMFWEKGYSWLTDQNLKLALKLFLPRLWSVAVYHINVLLIDTMLASFSTVVGNGAIAALYFANRFVQLPLAVVSLSVSRAALPDLAVLAENDDRDSFAAALTFMILVVLTLILPISLSFMFFPEVFIKVLGSGNFGQGDIARVSFILAAYAPGIVFYSLNRILVHSFYAYKNTRTPAIAATISLLANIVISIVLMFFLQAAGLALASSLAAMLQFGYLFVILRKKIGFVTKSIWPEVFKISFAAVVMSLTARASQTLSFNAVHRFVPLCITVLVSVVVYGLLAYLLKFKVIKWMKK